MIKLTPEQIQALEHGDEIVVLVRMEPQPSEGAVMLQVDGGTWTEAMFCWPHQRRFYKPPVAVGDTVDVDGSNGWAWWMKKAATVRHIAYREQDGHCWEVRLSK
jgi:hypothetical protein